MKFQFEIPEILDKIHNDSKLDYYNRQLDSKNTSEGFLLKKTKPSTKTDSLTYFDNIGYKMTDLNESSEEATDIGSNQKYVTAKKNN